MNLDDPKMRRSAFRILNLAVFAATAAVQSICESEIEKCNQALGEQPTNIFNYRDIYDKVYNLIKSNDQK